MQDFRATYKLQTIILKSVNFHVAKKYADVLKKTEHWNLV